MSDVYYFPGQFQCMYCKVDFDREGMLALPTGDSIDFRCPECGALWRFWVDVQLHLKLIEGGAFNKKERI